MDITWRNEKRKLSDLIPAEYNPRQMTEEQVTQLRKSIDKFALCDPIVINANNTIIGGHMRINILKERGTEEVDVRVPDRELTQDEEKELNLRLNKNLGEWDFDLLANMDIDILKEVGFNEYDLSKLIIPDVLPKVDIQGIIEQDDYLIILFSGEEGVDFRRKYGLKDNAKTVKYNILNDKL